MAPTIIVSLKHVTLITRADDRREGGTLSPVALVQQALGRRPAWLLAVGMVGISLFFGDAIITPAMSVLSAVEGLSLVTPTFGPHVVPVTLAIIVGLFLIRSRGIGTVSIFFGPIRVAWFLVIGGAGAAAHRRRPVHPARAQPGPRRGLPGDERLRVPDRAGLGVPGRHRGRGTLRRHGPLRAHPIRLAWVGLVWPALTLSHLGQGAPVLSDPEAAHNPFPLMAPPWLFLPLVILATFAQ